jgi:F-type H+-transporting ATPase subunit c
MEGLEIAKAAAFIGAAIAMGVGGMAPAYGQGLIGATACESIGKYPESASKIRLAMIIAMGFVESTAVYALIIAGALILFNK